MIARPIVPGRYGRDHLGRHIIDLSDIPVAWPETWGELTSWQAAHLQDALQLPERQPDWTVLLRAVRRHLQLRELALVSLYETAPWPPSPKRDLWIMETFVPCSTRRAYFTDYSLGTSWRLPDEVVEELRMQFVRYPLVGVGAGRECTPCHYGVNGDENLAVQANETPTNLCDGLDHTESATATSGPSLVGDPASERPDSREDADDLVEVSKHLERRRLDLDSHEVLPSLLKEAASLLARLVVCLEADEAVAL